MSSYTLLSMCLDKLREKIASKYYRIRDKAAPQGTGRRLFLNILFETTIKTERFFKIDNFTTFVRLVYYFVRDRELAERLLEKQGMTKTYRNITKSLSSQFVNNAGNLAKQPFAFPKVDNAQVSIVIPVYNKWVFTYKCLYSLWASRESILMEVIVVDNCSTDETSMLTMSFKNVKVYRSEENLGFLKASNLGAQMASGKYLLFLNNDVLVTHGLLGTMIDLVENDNRVGIVGAKLIYPDGSLQEAGGIVWDDPDNIALNFGRYNSPARWEYNYVKEVDYCSGACLLIKKKLFFDVGLFDELYAPAYFEDTDLAFKIRDAGYKVMYQPAANAIHFEGTTAGSDLSSGFKRFQNVNRSKFYNRWKSVLEHGHFGVGEHVFLARDRSRHKKVVLYVDHQVPTFDLDAGSKITYEYLKLFTNMGFKVVFWPDTLEKLEPYTSVIQQMGIEVVYGYGSLNGYLRAYGKYLNYIFLCRPLIAKRYIDIAKRESKARLLYVAHDLHFLRESRRANLEKNLKLQRFADKLKKIELNLVARSDVSLVFSNAEREILHAECGDTACVEIMPWIQGINKNHTGFFERKDLMFIGSFIHKPNEDGILWFVEMVFPQIRRRLKDLKLFIVGNNPTAKLIKLRSDAILVTGYVPDTSEYFHSSRVLLPRFAMELE